VLACAHRQTLTTAELRGVVALIQGAVGRAQVEYILAQPREALAQSQATGVRPQDPRLSAAGNRVTRHLGQLLEQLARMESWLRHRGRAELTVPDRSLLADGFGRLGRDAGAVATLAVDLYEEMRLP
jgi:hypothetical protein